MRVYTINADSEEQGAVVTARTSRSPDTFDVILEEVRGKGHAEFIEKNVLGYGHDSVAEMAQCPPIALEDISDLAANIIATSDPQLVVQMTSTRYQNMAEREVYGWLGNPSPRGREMKSKYMSVMESLGQILERKHYSHIKHRRTLTCDIARAFLPAGVSTQMAIRGNARVMRDAINFMLGHKLSEVREAGRLVLESSKDHIEVLLDRHVTGSPSGYAKTAPTKLALGRAEFNENPNKVGDYGVIGELEAWKKSGWRRRMRLSAAPFGPFPTAVICSDWGAYRDLRRNRTLHQSDILPDPMDLPEDPYWAFRELYPRLCDDLDNDDMTSGTHELVETTDPYLAPMGAIVTWKAGGHMLNWAYAMRLRTTSKCHPAYSIPMRYLMRSLLETPIGDAMGLVYDSQALLEVEFEDRTTR